MAAQINYEDNLYYLSILLRHMRNGIALDIDPDFFMQKTVDDILFHNNLLGKLYSSLLKNPHLIQRPELLRLILLAKKDFVVFLDSIGNEDSHFAKGLQAFFPQFSQCRSQNQEDISEIQALLEGPVDMSSENGDIITQDEYKFLFHAEQE